MTSPTFAPPITNPFGLKVVGWYSSIKLADIDADGDLDIWIGGGHGDTLFFQNIGTAGNPVFAEPKTNPFGLKDVGGESKPSFADLDADGDLDALIGNWKGNTKFFQNIGTTDNPDFAAPISNAFGLTHVGYGGSNPTLGDMDGDGDLDAFIQEYFYRNTGTASNPSFAAPINNSFEGIDTLVDLDGDGDLDVFAGKDFYRNTGNATQYKFKLLDNPFGFTNMDTVRSLALGDIDADGDLDAFSINSDGKIELYRNSPIVNLSVSRNSASEENTTVITVTATASRAVIKKQKVELAITGSGITSDDYTLKKSTIFIHDGETTGSVTFSIVDDALGEPTEIAFLTITNPSVGLQLGSITTETITITDNDGIKIMASGKGNKVAEGGSPDTYKLVMKGQPTAPVTVTLNPGSQLITSPSTLIFTPDNWNKPQKLTVTAVDDLGIEGNHYGQITHSATSADPNYNGIVFESAFFTIKDNDLSPGDPTFRPPIANPFGLKNVGLGYDSAPTFADIDRDGDLDVFVNDVLANNDEGNSLFYQNTGSASNPVFAEPIANPFGIASPEVFADIDGDGDLDTFLGNTFSENISTNDSPLFASPIANAFGLAGVDTFGDIDRDGDLDAFYGYGRNTLFCENTGTVSNPIFAEPITNPFGLKELEDRGRPVLADIDGDGDLDLFVTGWTSYSGYYKDMTAFTEFFRNTGTESNPVFAEPISSPFGLTTFSVLGHFTFADPDGDGDLDAFVQGNNGDILFYRNSPPVNLSVSTNSGKEAGKTVITVTATASRAVSGDQTVHLSVAGTNITPKDYALSNKTITISDGETIGSVSLTVKNDALSEGTETVFLTLTKPSVGIQLGSFSSETVTIVDNDGVAITTTDEDTNVTEEGTTDSYKVVLRKQPTGNVTISISPGSQLSTSVSSLTFTPENWNEPQTVTVTALDDPVNEGKHSGQITHTVSSVDPHYNDSPVDPVVVGITDNDLSPGDPSFAAPVTNPFGIANQPTLADIDGDGDLDAFVGTDFYRNKGTTSDPVFAKPTKNPFGFTIDGWNSGPNFVDLDGDGDLDAVFGNGEGDLLFFRNTGMADNPIFDASITNPFGLVSLANNSQSVIDNNSRPTFADIDGDGDFDAFVTVNEYGNGYYGSYLTDSNTYFCENTGTTSNPIFAPPTSNPFGLTNDGNWVGTAFGDIDGDGDLDAFVGTREWNSSPLFYRNIGTANDPIFAEPIANFFELTYVEDDSTPTFADIDGDGDLDGFVGVQFYRNSPLVNLSVSPNSGTEADKTVITVTATTSRAVSEKQTVDLAVTGTDITPKDYTLSNSTITIPKGKTTGSVTFTVKDDALIEATETAFLTISNPSVGIQLGDTLSETIAITANDGVDIAPSDNSTQISEDGATDTYTVVLSTKPTAPVTITLNPGSQLITSVPNLSFSSDNWNLPQTVTVTAVDDPGIEGNHYGQITHSASSVDPNYKNIVINPLVVDITDNDLPLGYPTFAPPKTNPFGLTNVGYESSPTFADIDADGDLDAFVGNSDDKTLYFFSNTGTSNKPIFAPPIANPFGITDVGRSSTPTLADIDGDGDLDALFGSSDGNSLFYCNTGTVSNPVFATPKTNPFGLTDVGYSSSPSLTDIDADGDLDAFVGNIDGNTLFYRNTGTASNPVFATPEPNPFGLTDVGYNSKPTFVDIDGDGDLDAFVGRWYNTMLFRNIGSASNPVFATPEPNPFGLTDVGSHSFSSFVDIDGDGDLDAFTGVDDGNTLFYRNSSLVNLSVSSNSGTEADGTVITVTATASSVVSSQQKVKLAVTGSNVTSEDYSLSKNTITIPKGQSTGSITLTVMNDDLGEATETVLLTLTKPSAGVYVANYPTQALTITDNDGIKIKPSGNSTNFTEGGGKDTYNVLLRQQPTAPVTIALNPSSQLTTSASTLTFTADNWNKPQKVTITAVNDTVNNGKHTGIITHSATSDDSHYNGIAIDPVIVAITEDDLPLGDPAFAPPETNPFGLTNVGYESRPTLTLADIDADGDLDLFVGTDVGYTWFFSNIGTANNPIFGTPETNPFGLTTVAENSSPTFGDLDGDGDLDALIGEENGNTLFYLNTGTATTPLFATPIINPFGLTNVGYESSPTPTLADIDADGDLDALIGNNEGNMLFYRNIGSVCYPVFATPESNPFGLNDVAGWFQSEFLHHRDTEDTEVF